MDNLSYNIQKQARKDDLATANWLSVNGLHLDSFDKTDPLILKAQRSATKLLKFYKKNFDFATINFLEDFKKKYANKRKRDKITKSECYRVLNIAGSIKRAEYKEARKKRNNYSMK